MNNYSEEIKKHSIIEIYFGKRILFLTDNQNPYYLKYEGRQQLKKIVDDFKQQKTQQLYISAKDLNELFLNFKSLFIYEEAAGGLVINSNHQILAIKNRGLWQLPKGHVEENESYAEAAVREVMEETGIDEPIIVEELPSTFHTFSEKNKWFLKRTYWFRMLYKKNTKPKPQSEEGITQAIWINKKDLWIVLDNTYENLKKIWNII